MLHGSPGGAPATLISVDDAVAQLTRDPARTGIAVDFDGTLAEIVPDPDSARPIPGARETLLSLSDHFAIVAVVSGRRVEFLLDRLQIAPVERLAIFGEYGIEEGRPDGTIRRDPAVNEYLDAVSGALEAARRQAPPGVYVEEKGISLTLNWRRAPERAEDTLALAATLGARFGLVARAGKMACELVPAVAADKGSVVSRLFAGLAAGCVLGDDVADLPAFSAVGALAASGGFVGVRVAVVSGEVPAQLVLAADLRVEGPAGALEFLRRLAVAA